MNAYLFLFVLSFALSSIFFISPKLLGQVRRYFCFAEDSSYACLFFSRSTHRSLAIRVHACVISLVSMKSAKFHAGIVFYFSSFLFSFLFLPFVCARTMAHRVYVRRGLTRRLYDREEEYAIPVTKSHNATL